MMHDGSMAVQVDFGEDFGEAELQDSELEEDYAAGRSR
jgi:hypothetical protein